MEEEKTAENPTNKQKRLKPRPGLPGVKAGRWNISRWKGQIQQRNLQNAQKTGNLVDLIYSQEWFRLGNHVLWEKLISREHFRWLSSRKKRIEF